MTRKDFELIAAALARLADSADKASCAQALAHALATTNPRFDRAKFLAACGVES